MIIISAMMISKIQQYDLFEIMILFGSMITIPYAMPLVWGIFFKSAPRWSAWSSLIVGLSFSAFIKWGFNPAWFGWTELSPRESSDLLYIWSGLGNITVCSIWFFITIWIAKATGYKTPEKVEELFEKLETPINYTGEGGVESDGKQARILGLLCFVYGGFITVLGLAIPNPLSGRLSFAFCGLFIVAIGGLLYRASKKGNPGDSKS